MAQTCYTPHVYTRSHCTPHETDSSARWFQNTRPCGAGVSAYALLRWWTPVGRGFSLTDWWCKRSECRWINSLVRSCSLLLNMYAAHQSKHSAREGLLTSCLVPVSHSQTGNLFPEKDVCDFPLLWVDYPKEFLLTIGFVRGHKNVATD